MNEKWDRRFLELARHISGWSKDPSTQVGAVIVDRHRRIVSVGFNGFAKGVTDHADRYANRDIKLRLVVHGEMNAILFATQSVQGCSLYTYPFAPCSVCAGMAIQSGIFQVISPPMPEDKKGRWAEDMALAAIQFREANVGLREVELK